MNTHTLKFTGWFNGSKRPVRIPVDRQLPKGIDNLPDGKPPSKSLIRFFPSDRLTRDKKAQYHQVISIDPKAVFRKFASGVRSFLNNV